jgi:hypothetical protein
MKTKEERTERIKYIQGCIEVVVKKEYPFPEAEGDLELLACKDEQCGPGDFIIKLKSSIRDQTYRFDKEKNDWFLTEGYMVS